MAKSRIGSIKSSTRKIDAQIKKIEAKNRKKAEIAKALREKEAKRKRLASLRKRS
jgi:hypothetical protein